MENGEKNAKKNPFVRAIYEVLPHIPKNRANKSIRKKIDSIGSMLPYEDDLSVLKGFNSPERVEIDLLKGMLEDNKHRMERLEDKAKVQIAGITIAISIMFGVAGNLKEISRDSACFKWVAFAVLVVSVIYMFSSGLEAINLLTNKNVFYYPPYNISEQTDEETRKSYNAVIAKNQLQNTIRNNEISTSYALMRNAIFLLILVFVAWTIPIG